MGAPVTITTDPLNKFADVPTHRLVEACGLLLPWLIAGEEETLRDRLINKYRFYNGPMWGGTISEDGVYQYPEDEPMHPLVKIETKNEKCFIYKYGIVGTLKEGVSWITRMD